MSNFMKCKKLLFLAITGGIIGFSTYGIYHTAHAYNDITQAQYNDNTLTLDSISPEDKIIPGGPFCNPLGCVACRGCGNSQYQQNIEVLPSSATQIEWINKYE